MADVPLATLLERARAFRADDPDPDTQAELDALLACGDEAELRERFAAAISFGTAGLRGLLGAGDSRMNRRVVAQTSAGLCAYLLREVADARARGLCVGFDGRHKSREFAQEVIAIATGAGFVVHTFSGCVPTPLLAFSVNACRAAAGVMITASHNPAAYNGYKLYLEDGAQLREPHDAAIAACIRSVGNVLTLARGAQQPAQLRDVSVLAARYRERVRAQLEPKPQLGALRVAYTALHGVGEPLARSVLADAGVTLLTSVREQAEPDPEFPSVKFPNPEEPGALDRLQALAEAEHVSVALANDPDADRLAVMARTASGALQVLTGNELGVLLADYLLGRAPADGKNLIVSSIVSTPLVHRIAAAHGARSEVTLTGFKWIVPRGLELARAGLRFVLGFEEALGYCIGDLVHDKDGIAAAAHVVCMAATYAERGQTLHQALETLYRQHGLFESRQISLQRPGQSGLAEMQASMQRLRESPPTQLAGQPVVQLRDLAAGSCIRNGQRSPSGLPYSDVLSFELAAGHRLTLRPSGTEPKLKIYLDCVTEVAQSEPLTAARQRARAIADELFDAFARAAGLD